jgi:tetratricopeptide (TPR) repeat protein
MGGGPGRHTARAGRRARAPRPAVKLVILGIALSAASGCVYFNALYNANRLYNQGRDEVERGQQAAGRASLTASIEKAERIVAQNPDSRWADDALRLVVRARILLEDWREAAEAGRELLRVAGSRADSIEVAGYLGQAELYLGFPGRADSLLSVAIPEAEGDERRALLLLSRGRARIALGRLDAADVDIQAASQLRPHWVQPRLERVRLLLQTGRGPQAADELGTVLGLVLNPAESGEVVATIEYVAQVSPQAALAGLASVESSNLERDERARLMKMRGDLQVALGRIDAARAEYQRVTAFAPDSRFAVEAEVALIRLDLQRAVDPSELAGPLAMLERVGRRPEARASRELAGLRETLIRMDYWTSTGGLGFLLAGETARDILNAPALAHRLFLKYPEEQPRALWAPKAILAAVALADLDSASQIGGPDVPSNEELRRRLLEDYADSAYVLALTGGVAPSGYTYEELETALRRQLERLRMEADQEVRSRTLAPRP